MDAGNKNRYCQSCGMPLRFDVEEYLGTNADSSHSDEYCYYCLKDGEYIVDIIPMTKMVDIWVKYTDKYNWYSGTNYTPQELRTLLNKRLPTLKRWNHKEETQHIHSEVINRVKTYIERNLFREIDPEQLAATANFSFYHFRKVFRNVTGENVGTYIQRLRLEYIAHLLIATGYSIEDIRRQTNYQSKFSLAKAFKKHFGISMSEYRAKYQPKAIKPQGDDSIQPTIRWINTRKAICLEVGHAFLDRKAYAAIWKKLADFKETHLRTDTDSRYISISQDNPFVTSMERKRFHLGILSSQSLQSDKEFSVQEIPGGMYAIFRHKGGYSGLPELYKTIYEQWLPGSIYHQNQPQTFEIYLNTPGETPLDELLTEIYIPIDK
ncbi:GyrI-like domain-containing protein [Proteiniphilum sp.]|nr:GyrI-like domain-containing protein [Proteiniphilum sp.]MEA4918824.1 GyrI-like domain-containing protein [Proteiniphilum sp.]